MTAMRCIIILVAFMCGACASLQAKDLSRLYSEVDGSVVVIKILENTISERRPGETETVSNMGSGVIISEDGLVMTAAHVVHLAEAVSVTLIDGRTLSAEVAGSFPMADVALVRIKHPPRGLTAAKLGDSDAVKTGERVFVIGAPRGLTHTLTVGYISGRRSPDNLSDNLIPVEYLQTDAAINVGNSGGPMFNMKGEVVGIVSSIISDSGGFEGIGFAASVNTARELLINQKAFWSGLDTLLVTGPLATALNVPQEAGLLVQRVAGNSLGKKLGLRPGKIWVNTEDQKFIIGGDIILSVQGIPVSTDAENWKRIRSILVQQDGHKNLSVTVLRAGKIIQLDAQ